MAFPNDFNNEIGTTRLSILVKRAEFKARLKPVNQLPWQLQMDAELSYNFLNRYNVILNFQNQPVEQLFRWISLINSPNQRQISLVTGRLWTMLYAFI